jgi:hypothetical protein
VSSFHPARNGALPTITSDRTCLEKEWYLAIKTDDSNGLETKDDWFDEPQQAMLPQKGAPKASEIFANEACLFSLCLHTHSYFL